MKLTLILTLTFSAAASAQTIPIVNSTPQPADARFAIIQGLAGLYQARFKLDRYTGQIWQADTNAWKPIKVTDLPAIPAVPKSPRFQMLWLFGAQGTSTQILLDCQTGRTWQLNGKATWEPDKESGDEKPEVNK